MSDVSGERFSSIQQRRTLPKVLQKPLGVGSFVGFLAGVANTVILGIPSLYSLPVGVILGMAVCIIASPAMRYQLNQYKLEQTNFKRQLLNRKGRKNAFTTYD
jgi:hypothetical protein